MFGGLLHGLVQHYIYMYILGALAPGGILAGAKFTLRPSFAFSYIDSVTARHSSSGRQPNFAAWHLHATRGHLVRHWRSNCLGLILSFRGGSKIWEGVRQGVGTEVIH